MSSCARASASRAPVISSHLCDGASDACHPRLIAFINVRVVQQQLRCAGDQQAACEVSVADVAGKQVFTLVEGHQAGAGRHRNHQPVAAPDPRNSLAPVVNRWSRSWATRLTSSVTGAMTREASQRPDSADIVVMSTTLTASNRANPSIDDAAVR